MINKSKENFFSIIIPHLNEWYYLDIMLDSIFTYFKYNNFEIIIVDDWSTYASDLNFCYQHMLKDKIKLFKKKSLGIANAKNFWAIMAKWNILCFFDWHMYFNIDILTILNNLFNTYLEIDLLQPQITSHNNKSVEGNIYKIKDLSLNSWWEEINFNHKIEIYETPNIIWAATIVKKSVFSKLWWFNQFFEVWWSEDLEFSMRAWLYWYKSFLTNKI